MTPTQRTLAECKRRGWIAQVVEKWNPHARVRQDLFGCIDIVACVPVSYPSKKHPLEGIDVFIPTEQPSYILGIQACAGSSHAARKTKALAEPRLRAWLGAGARFEVWSWSKRGPRGKRKTWQLREEAL